MTDTLTLDTLKSWDTLKPLFVDDQGIYAIPDMVKVSAGTIFLDNIAQEPPAHLPERLDYAKLAVYVSKQIVDAALYGYESYGDEFNEKVLEQAVEQRQIAESILKVITDSVAAVGG